MAGVRPRDEARRRGAQRSRAPAAAGSGGGSGKTVGADAAAKAPGTGHTPCLDVSIRALAAGGAGVATLPDGRVVFVPRTAPDERVRVRIAKSAKTWAKGELMEVLDPSPDRRPALCSLYDVCGGCALQHLREERQREWKGRFVADALERIGGLDGVFAPEVVPSPRPTEYRNRVTYTLRRLRGGRVVAGFHALERPAHVVDVAAECVLPEPELQHAWRLLRTGWGSGARLLPDAGQLRLTLRKTDSGVALVVEGGGPGWDAAPLAAAAPVFTAIWYRPQGGELRLVVGSPPQTRTVDHLAAMGDPTRPAASQQRERDAPTLSPQPPGEDPSADIAFVQVNSEAAALLVEHVLQVAGSGGHAVDAYCGTGLYGRELARRGWTVAGIELDEAGCAAAAHDAPAGFSLVAGRVEERLPSLLPCDLLIVNPPRTGLHPDVTTVLAEGGASRVVYVSCDPATLARDVKRLAAAYTLDDLRAFDLFPQTAHVETVAVLETRS